MMIIACRWRGRRIEAPRGSQTRPTSDRTREGIFSVVYSLIGDLDGLRVLDLYAGSGALGLEALSRGAAGCVFVESDARAASVIEQNLRSLGAGLSEGRIVKTQVERAVATLGQGPAAALLLADPPYRIEPSDFSQVLEELASGGSLEVGGLAVFEHSKETVAVWPPGFRSCFDRRYGDTTVSFATYEGETAS
jgi:16S rRNA (guanine966-N2)-methyltransferase